MRHSPFESRASRLCRCAHPPARTFRRSRNIGKFTGSSVIGVTLNQYQVDRGNALCKKAGLDKCKLVKVRPAQPSLAQPSPAPQLAAARRSWPQLAVARQPSARHGAAAASGS